jgi:ferredoxin-NADP reductase
MLATNTLSNKPVVTLEYPVKVKSVSKVTHNVLRIVTEKPWNYMFTPGQATDIAINKHGWRTEKRPFTFTSLPKDDYLEFTIKTYPEHLDVTDQLLHLKKNDELILHKVFGSISYQGEGIFIAGGAGVTPFVAILRDLKSRNEIGNNKLLFANKSKADIIYEEELKNILGKNFINILSMEKVEGYPNGQITEGFLKANMDGSEKKFYLCGPPPMMEVVEKQLANLHIDEKSIIKESF